MDNKKRLVPKIEFHIHDVAVRMFLVPNSPAKRQEFEENAKKLIDFFESHKNVVLEKIQEFSGYEWSKSEIPVYLIPWGQVISFTKPVLEEDLPGIVQCVNISNKGITRDIHVLIHEMCHVNQFQSSFASKENSYFTEMPKMELCADLVTSSVLKDLFGKDSEIYADFIDFLSNTNEKNKLKYLQFTQHEPMWNLSIKPLKEYLTS